MSQSGYYCVRIQISFFCVYMCVHAYVWVNSRHTYEGPDNKKKEVEGESGIEHSKKKGSFGGSSSLFL